MIKQKLLLALALVAVVVERSNSESIQIYYQIQFPSFSPVNDIKTSYSPVNVATVDQEIGLTGFQNVIKIADVGSYLLDIRITDLKARHVVFCLYKSGQGKKNPEVDFIDDRLKADVWSLECDVVSTKATLNMAKRVFLKKPEGVL